MRDSRKTRAGILVVCLFMLGQMGLTPLLADIAASFPDVPTRGIQMIQALPSLVVVLAAAAAGILVTLFPKRLLIAAGLLLLVAAGAGGTFLHGSPGILCLWSVLIGAGMGLLTPTTFLLISEQYDGAERGRMLGLQAASSNFGAIALSLLGGFLGAAVWSRGYLAYVLLALPAFPVALACLPGKNGGLTRERIQINDAVIRHTGMAVLFFVVYMVYATNIAMLIAEKHLGDSSTAGIAGSFALLGGMAGGLFFGPVSGRLGRYTMAFAVALCGVGYWTASLADALPVLLAASCIAGASISFFMSQAIFSTSRALPAEGRAMGLAAVSTFGNLGGFFSPLLFTPLAEALGDGSAQFRFQAAGCAAFLLALLFAAILAVRQKPARLPPDA
jgi:MFS family permease